MNSERAYRTARAVDEVSKWTVGTGIVLFALFPLSIPILILTAAALLPLAVPLLALALLAAVVIGPALLVKAIWRRFRGRGRTQEATPSRGPLLTNEPLDERVV